MAASPSPARVRILRELSNRILAVPCPHPLRVAIDGVDAAGKTHLAGELAAWIETGGRPVLRVSEDGFHRPRLQRYQRGPDSPLGYYLDSFDTPAILASVLLPLGSGGNRRYRTAAFDHRSDHSIPAGWQAAPQNGVLLFDGIFLFRPELNPHWDYRIFIQVSFETSVKRGCQRDLSSNEAGTLEALQKRYWQRYVAGQQIYLQTVQPENLADVIVINDDLDQPGIFARAA